MERYRDIILYAMLKIWRRSKTVIYTCIRTAAPSICHSILLTTLHVLHVHNQYSAFCFQMTFATGVVCRQGTLTPPNTWFRPIGNSHIIFVLKPIISQTCRDLRTMHFEYPPRYFLEFAWLFFNTTFFNINMQQSSCLFQIRDFKQVDSSYCRYLEIRVF